MLVLTPVYIILLPDNLASLNIGMKHLDRRGGENEAVPKAQVNERRGGGFIYKKILGN